MGPTNEEAEKLVRELRGGRGRNRRNFEKCVDMQNIIPVSCLFIFFATDLQFIDKQ
jgi:hypothetical protein